MRIKILLTCAFLAASCASQKQTNESADEFKKIYGTYVFDSTTLSAWSSNKTFGPLYIYLMDDYSYELHYNQESCTGVYSLKRIANKDSLVNYEYDYPSQDICNIYRFSFSKANIELPLEIESIFSGALSNYQFLYNYIDGKTKEYGVSTYMIKKGNGATMVDSAGEVVGIDETILFVHA